MNPKFIVILTNKNTRRCFMHRLLGKPKKSKSKLLTGDALEAKRGKFEMLLLQCIHLPKQIIVTQFI